MLPRIRSIWIASLCWIAGPIQANGVAEGLAIMANRASGNCVSCHQIPALQEGTNALTLQGNFGPSLHGVGSRYDLSQLRQWVIDARVFRADTLMPPYGSTQGLHLSAQAQQLLTSNQIDAVVQALASFKSSSPPGLPQSALPTAMSAGLGELQALPAMNPMNLWVDQGQRRWAHECQGCHSLEEVARSIPRTPRLDPTGRLINLEDQIHACRLRVQKTSTLPVSSSNDDTVTLELSAFLSEAAGQLLVSMAAPVRPAEAVLWERHRQAGEQMFNTRTGAMNLSCRQCHDGKVGALMRAQRVNAGHPTGYPVYRVSWQTLGSIERRIRACFSGVQAQVPEPGDVRLRQLELYLKTRAHGLPLQGPSIRQ